MALEHLFFVQANSDKVPYISFEYTEGGCQLEVDAFDELDDAEFLHDAAQTTVNTGREHLVLVQVLEGEETSSWPVQMRNLSKG